MLKMLRTTYDSPHQEIKQLMRKTRLSEEFKIKAKVNSEEELYETDQNGS